VIHIKINLKSSPLIDQREKNCDDYIYEGEQREKEKKNILLLLVQNLNLN